MTDLVVQRPQGLYCPAADLWIDPWRPVPRAVITHAHADHARRGHAAYLTHHHGAALLRARLGDVPLQTLGYGEPLQIGPVTLSLHPAGHVLGSSQVRLAHRGQVWVVSGDYFLAGDHPHEIDPRPTCPPFEPVRCDCFVTESTFGLPIYRWRSRAELMAEIDAWWRRNAADGRPSLLLGYSLGKAQRLLAGVDATIGPIAVHDSVADINRAYLDAGVHLPPCRPLEALDAAARSQALIVAPPMSRSGAWATALPDCSVAFASGWMHTRAMRRRRGAGRGFAVSDHADWPGLLRAIEATRAERVIVMHGSEDLLIRWLEEQGLRAGRFGTGGAAPDTPADPSETPTADAAAEVARSPDAAATQRHGG